MANTKLAQAAPGTVVKLNESGAPVEFLVLQQGYPEENNGNTLLLRNDCYDKRAWGATKNIWDGNSMDVFLNGEYLQLLDEDVQNGIVEVAMPYVPGGGNYTASTIRRKVGLLTATELGVSRQYTPVCGTAIPYFNNDLKRIAKYNGNAVRWWTMIPRSYESGYAEAIMEAGIVPSSVNSFEIHQLYGSRPKFCLVGADWELTEDGTLVKASAGTGMFIPASELEQGVEYYFRVFPRNHQNQFQTGIDGSVVTAIPGSAKVMTAVIDLSDSNPATCVSYADDAANMQAGSAEWDEFFGHYPCLFKDGAEVGKLNPNDFSKFADGTNADITSGAAGDVMIAFPRRGVKITTSGTKVTVSMTNGASEDGFSYLAHQRGETNKDVFYLGVYKGFVDSGKLRSLSGKTPTVKQYIQTFRTQAQANGAGYEQSAFYQLLFRQCMYILKYKNLNNQQAVGMGYVWAPDGQLIPVQTGATNASGMDWGDKTALTSRVKLFGMEDFWGNVYEFIDGLYINTTWNILTATDGFNDSGTGYTDCGKGASDNQTSGFMQSAQGTAQTGFIPKTFAGSETTYYCDSATFVRGAVPMYGGYFRSNKGAGVFNLNIDVATSSAQNHIGSRLMYL
nr:MAG TPA: tail collar fiber protein [Caudoviricetes sp.]